MPTLRFVDVTDASTFGLIPPCADPAFDHRTCDYWEDVQRGSRAARPAWLDAPAEPAPESSPSAPRNPFADPGGDDRPFNPFAPPSAAAPPRNPFAVDADDDPLADNPFAPSRPIRPKVEAGAPPKLRLLGRGLGVFGGYAKVALDGDAAVGYSQFGPLSAYPRAMHVRELYPSLPESPLPAVITCIATTAEARHRGIAVALVQAVCDDLAGRGFSAVEAYPERGRDPDATSAATPEFWIRCGFRIVADDERFPVVRREL
jgi:ribosomal protein S18 acetylase RimI-like enzyme